MKKQILILTVAVLMFAGVAVGVARLLQSRALSRTRTEGYPFNLKVIDPSTTELTIDTFDTYTEIASEQGVYASEFGGAPYGAKPTMVDDKSIIFCMALDDVVTGAMHIKATPVWDGIEPDATTPLSLHIVIDDGGGDLVVASGVFATLTDTYALTSGVSHEIDEDWLTYWKNHGDAYRVYVLLECRYDDLPLDEATSASQAEAGTEFSFTCSVEFSEDGTY